MDDFFVRALLGGLGVALIAGPMGCFIIWRRMSYFGGALAHSALLGVALGFLLGLSPTVGIIATCLGFALLLVTMQRYHLLANDTLLGILAHATLALGLVIMAFMENLRIDLMGYLFGDILSVSRDDLMIIYAMMVVTMGILVWLWRPLLSATIQPELARIEGVPVDRVNLVFVLLIAILIAIGMKVVGVLLIISMLIIPAAAARRFSRTPEQMALYAALLGALSVIGGLFSSLQWDLPSGPSVVVAATGLLVLAFLVPQRA